MPDPSTLTALGLVCSLKPSPAPSSSAQRVLERLDAELSNTDDSGTPALVGKVAIVSVVGNEDAAACNAAHLARTMSARRYPAYQA